MHLLQKVNMMCGGQHTAVCNKNILTALGHNPFSFALEATSPTASVHGSVTVAFCDDRTLGEDVLEFKDGTRQLATAENIGPWLAEQGHKVVSIIGNIVRGDTIIDVEVYEQDDPPKGRRTTHLKRPGTMPTEAALRAKLATLGALV